MMFDVKQYESWDEGDARKTYRHLRNVIERTIARTKEDKHSAARDKYAREFANAGKPTTPAPATLSLAVIPLSIQKQRRSRKPSQRQSLILQLQYYLRHNQSRMLRGKAKESPEIRASRHPRVQRTKRRSHVIFTL